MIRIVGIDVSKPIFEIYGTDEFGHVAVCSKMNHSELSAYFSNLDQCRIGIAIDDEYAALARHWARKLESYNHKVTLLAYDFVSAHAKARGLERAGAEAICRALEQL